MAHSAQWFDTDKDGLSKQAQEAGRASTSLTGTDARISLKEKPRTDEHRR